MIRILLVDDQTLLCEVLQSWLEAEEDFQVVGRAYNGQIAIEQVEALKPDLVLIDIEMPVMDGLTATQIICQRWSNIKVIVLSGYEDEAYLAKSLQAGAKGYLLKNMAASELVKTIRSVYQAHQQDSQTDLELIRTQIAEFAQTYEQFKQNLEAATTILAEIAQTEARLNHRASELETAIQSKWVELRGEISNVQKKAKITLKDIAQAKEKFDRYLTELKTLKTDFEVTLDQLNQAGFNPVNFRKIYKLEDQFREGMLSLQNMKKQLSLIYYCLVFAILTIVIVVFFFIVI
jgi:YesN/AraC family two-component response regulator